MNTPGGPQSRMGYGKPGVIPLRPLSLGEILDGAVTTIRTHAGVVIGMSVAVMTVVQLLNALVLLAFDDQLRTTPVPDTSLTAEQARAVLGDLAGGLGVMFAVTQLGTAVLAGFLTVVVGKAVLGRPVRPRQAWAEIVPMLPRLLGLTVLYTLVTFLGFVLFVIPGVWLYVLFALATPALVLERGTVVEAMRRSRLLVTGSWWRVFGALLLALVLAFIVRFLVATPFQALSGGASVLDESPNIGDVLLSNLGWVVAGAIAHPFVACVTALLHVDQRMRREGMDGQLARAAGVV